MKLHNLRAVSAGALLFAATASAAQTVRNGLSSVEVFSAAAEAANAGETDDALALYDALTRDPDAEVRAEARFRRGMLLAEVHRYDDAAVAFRALLDEKPDAARVRLELARVLALKGDEAGARRALRQAQAAGLPRHVAIVVDQFAAALRSPKRFGGSIQLALAPDTNINRATSARTLDTVIAPLTLSDEARQQSGLGVRASGQAYARMSVGSNLTLLPRLSGSGVMYRESAFDDIFNSALLGLEWRRGRDRITVSAGPTWRWYGGSLYARTDTLAGDWLHPIGGRAQLTISGSAAKARYRTNSLQNGGLFDLSANGEYALSPRAGIGGTLGATRQTARDPGYATVSSYAALFGWRDVGRTTLFANAMLRRTEGDARLALFPDRRRDWLYQLSGGATFRALSYRGFAPLIRMGVERNVSTVGLYHYSRLTTEIGMARAF